jgi:hypothetical protein
MTNIIEDLKRARINDDTTVNNLVNELFKRCLKFIKYKNKNGITNITYEIPAIVPGFPLYEQEITTLKLNKILKKEGFKTTYYPPNKIYISW